MSEEFRRLRTTFVYQPTQGIVSVWTELAILDALDRMVDDSNCGPALELIMQAWKNFNS